MTAIEELMKKYPPKVVHMVDTDLTKRLNLEGCYSAISRCGAVVAVAYQHSTVPPPCTRPIGHSGPHVSSGVYWAAWSPAVVAPLTLVRQLP